MNPPLHRGPSESGPAAGLARALSKLGFCSRRQARELILAGRVRVNGVVVRDPERRVRLHADHFQVGAETVAAGRKVYVMLNKPRGLITTASDERGRDTVFRCLADAGLPFVGAVGRLDKASEGLLLFTNDTQWAAGLTAPESRVEKTYHVQIDRLADDGLIQRLEKGVLAGNELLSVKRASRLRQGEKNSWLELVLEEGRNRHIRRLLEAAGIGVLRLVRISIGHLQLGALPKGQFRHLTREEVKTLATRSSAL